MAQHITTLQSEYKFQFDISGSNFVFYKCRKIRFSNVDITVKAKLNFQIVSQKHLPKGEITLANCVSSIYIDIYLHVIPLLINYVSPVIYLIFNGFISY